MNSRCLKSLCSNKNLPRTALVAPPPAVLLLLAVLVLLTGLASPVMAHPPAVDDWPSFRGADAMSTAKDDPRLPRSWSTTENVAWVVEIPGLGWSSPVVSGERVFVTTVSTEGEVEEPKKGLYFGGNRMKPSEDRHEWRVYALDLDSGKELWQRTVHSAAPEFPRHLKNTYASETPVTDGELVYAYFGNLGIFALDLDGEPVWEKRFDVVKTRFGWGTAASPILHGDVLFLVNDNDEQSWFMALDKKTGKELWRKERDEGSNWSTPYVWENELRTEVVTTGTDQVRSYDLEGNLLWTLEGMSSITITQPFSAHGLLYISSGYIGDDHRPTYAIRPGGSGDISLAEGARSNQYVVWYQPQAGPYNPTPLVYGDYYFTLLDRGFYTVHDAKTGEELYFTDQQKSKNEVRRRIAPGAGAFTSSPWAYNGLVFVLSEDGDTYVIQAGEQWEVVGTNSLDEMAMSTPAIADGKLLLRTRSKLYCLTNSSVD
jgi:outer membrane protein assembly factor BamB